MRELKANSAGFTARKLETFNCVELAAIDSVEQITTKLLNLHSAFAAAGSAVISHDNIAAIKRYSRKEQALLLASIFEEVNGRTTSTAQIAVTDP